MVPNISVHPLDPSWFLGGILIWTEDGITIEFPSHTGLLGMRGVGKGNDRHSTLHLLFFKSVHGRSFRPAMLKIDLKLWDICFCIPWRFLNLLQPISRHVSGSSFSRPTKIASHLVTRPMSSKASWMSRSSKFLGTWSPELPGEMAMWGFGQDPMANLGYLREKPDLRLMR